MRYNRRVKLTKIIATIGPSTESEESIRSLIEHGVNIIRFNFKHNDVNWHRQMIERVKKIASELKQPVGTLLDLQGPEIRITLSQPTLEVFEDKPIELGTEEFTISHPHIIAHIKDKQRIVVDDGQFIFHAQIKDKKLFLIPAQSGVLKNNKSMNLPGAEFPVSSLTSRDLTGLDVAAEVKIDYVALSFVRSVKDIEKLRTELDKRKLRAKVISKIEAQKAIDSLDEIIERSDAIMVARGDLGVEMPIEMVPYIQKTIINKCIVFGKPVITATQMLESMVANPFPTRAEISDVANAVFDLTDAVMLSGETASGKHPIATVKLMARVAVYNETKAFEDVRLEHSYVVQTQGELLCDAAYNLFHKSTKKNNIKAFLVFSQSGKTVRSLARYRPHVPIYALSPTDETNRSLTLSFGVFPLRLEDVKIDAEVRKEDIKKTVKFLRTQGHLKKQDVVIVIHGEKWGEIGGASTIRMITVD